MLYKRFSRTADTFLVIPFLRKRTFSTATSFIATYPTSNIVSQKPTLGAPFGFLASTGAYTPVLPKQSKRFSFDGTLASAVVRMQKNFNPLKQQIRKWRALSEGQCLYGLSFPVICQQGK
jgi:hypothetical protein